MQFLIIEEVALCCWSCSSVKTGSNSISERVSNLGQSRDLFCAINQMVYLFLNYSASNYSESADVLVIILFFQHVHGHTVSCLTYMHSPFFLLVCSCGKMSYSLKTFPRFPATGMALDTAEARRQVKGGWGPGWRHCSPELVPTPSLLVSFYLPNQKSV